MACHSYKLKGSRPTIYWQWAWIYIFCLTKARGKRGKPFSSQIERQIRRRCWLHWDFTFPRRGWPHRSSLFPSSSGFRQFEWMGREYHMFSWYACMCIDCNRAIIYTPAERHRGRCTRLRPTSRPSTPRGSRALQDLHIYDFQFHTSLLHFIRGDTRFANAYLGDPRIQIDENQKGESTLFNTKFVETDCLVFSATHGPPWILASIARRGRDLVCTARY